MAICVKSGVPGSGKTQSMVSELLDIVAGWKKSGAVRPIFTNITGLDKAQIPHTVMTNVPPPGEKFDRVEGVLYTVDWQQCPPESIIIIDEAQENGYEARSTQQAVPAHVGKLAVHRKDYSVDIWFITQHPKLLHVSLRRQAGKHQHYERKFGFKRAGVFEWHHCEDMLGQRKVAVFSQFVFSKRAQSAYHSADVHTKQSFKMPWFMWIGLAMIPAGLYFAPKAFHAVYSTMSGKGLSSAVPLSSAAAATVPGSVVTSVATVSPASAPVGVAAAPALVFAGCMAMRTRCECLGVDGRLVEVTPERCETNVGQSGHDVPYLTASARQVDSAMSRLAMPNPVPVSSVAIALGSSSDKH